MANKPSTTKRTELEEENISILEHFGIDDTPPPTPEDKTAKPIDVDALVARLDRLESDNVSLQQSNLALMSAPKQTSIPAPAPQPVSFTEGLPDPVADPESYNLALEQRIGQRIDSAVSASEAKASDSQKSTNRIESLWGEFNKTHPEHAANTALTEFCATKVAEEADRKGLNLESYMYTNSKQFFNDIVSEMDSMLPKADEKKAEVVKDVPEEEDTSRTGGIFGGMESGGSPSDNGEGVGGDLISDLTDIQRKSEYF